MNFESGSERDERDFARLAHAVLDPMKGANGNRCSRR
jgi:hypothetical protein